MTTSASSQEKSVELDLLSERFQLPLTTDLVDYRVAPEFLNEFPIGFSREKLVVGLLSKNHGETQNGQVVGAFCSEAGWKVLDTVARILRRPVIPMLVAREQVLSLINRAYSQMDSQAGQMLDSLQSESLVELALESSSEDLLDASDRAPIIQLVNQLLLDAVQAGASDIHVQPREDAVLVRQRIDGVLFDAFTLPKQIQEEVITRIKVLGRMNIAEKRLPQDGRATVELGERVVDLRIASLPTNHSERVVIRILDKSARLYTLGELGMDAATLTKWRSLIHRDHGLVLVTGPTGSGKSTTLYSTLQEINSQELNVLTIEDPIEYQLPGISQSQINEKKGMTFASGMRSVLRQDPDIIMVGEIRDAETATMAIQASLTGHLVFSTLHTNDAASAVTRLLDLGIEPYLVASSLIGSLAQRLIRRLCPECKIPVNTPAVGEDRFSPDGCSRCRQSGFSGRIGLFELLAVEDGCRQLIQERVSASDIRELAINQGMHLLAQDGASKIEQGVTTQAEVVRATSSGATSSNAVSDD